MKQLPDRWTQQQTDDLYAEGVVDGDDEPTTIDDDDVADDELTWGEWFDAMERRANEASQ